MVRCSKCSDEPEVVSGTCTRCGEAVAAAYEAPDYESPTVPVKVLAESGTVSFEDSYGHVNSESASSFMSILAQHDDSVPNQGLINAALARDTDTPAPPLNTGPVTLPQSHIEQIRNKLNQAAAVLSAEPADSRASSVTITNSPSGQVTATRIVRESEPEADLPATVAIRPQLIVVRGERLDVAYPILKGKNFIGRMADQPVDIDLESQEPVERIWTSRQHAVITYENGAVILEDLASLNGTFVNRSRLYPGHAKMLQPGDVVQIGTVQLRLSIE